MSIELLHKHIYDIERRSKRLHQAPTVPIYDLTATPPVVGNVMKVQCGTGFVGTSPSYGTINFTMPGGGCWLYFRGRYMQQLVEDCYFLSGGQSSPQIVATKDVTSLHDYIHIRDTGPVGFPTPWDWDVGSFGDTGVVATGDAWHVIEAHYDGTNITWYMDGPVLTGPNSATFGGGIVGSPFSFGCIDPPGGIPVTDFLYVGDIRIGTSRAASDIKLIDFSTNDLSQFSSLTNSAHLSVIPNFA